MKNICNLKVAKKVNDFFFVAEVAELFKKQTTVTIGVDSIIGLKVVQFQVSSTQTLLAINQTMEGSVMWPECKLF